MKMPATKHVYWDGEGMVKGESCTLANMPSDVACEGELDWYQLLVGEWGTDSPSIHGGFCKAHAAIGRAQEKAAREKAGLL